MFRLAASDPMHHLLQRDRLFEMPLPEFLWRDWPNGLGISKPVIYMWVAALLTFLIFRHVAKNWQHVPRGLQALIEPLIIFVRDDIVRGNIKAPHHPVSIKEHVEGSGSAQEISMPAAEAHEDDHDHAVADQYLPLCWTMFFFILMCNLIGLTPHGIAATGQFSMTAALAAISAVFIIGSGLRYNGAVGYWLGLVPPSVPMTFAKVIPNPIWIMVFLLEFAGLFFKPFALAIRLMANMTGGHVIIFVMLTFVAWMQLFHPFAGVPSDVPLAMGIPVALVSLLAATLITGFEILIALVQAYVFTLLTATFIGMAVAPEH